MIQSIAMFPKCRCISVVVLCLMLLTVACGGSSIDISPDTAVPSDTASPTVEDEDSESGSVEDPQAGSVLGNPTQTRSLIQFVDVTPELDEDESDQTASEDTSTTVATAPTCQKITLGNGAVTQTCDLTPDNYGFGIMAIYLVECRDTQDLVSPCTFNTVASKRIPLYSGPFIQMVFSSIGEILEEELMTTDQDIQVGGIQFVLANTLQDFPSEINNPEDAAHLMAELRGREFIICHTPAGTTSAEERLSQCGHEEAQRGDYLVYNEETGAFEFLVFSKGSGLTTPHRPAFYERYMPPSAPDAMYKNIGQLTTEDFFGVAGYDAPFYSLESVAELKTGQGFTATIQMDRTRTLGFTDDGLWFFRNAFTNAVFSPDLDGIYIPNQDGPFRMNHPDVTATVQVNP